MGIGYMETLCHFAQGTWAVADFSILVYVGILKPILLEYWTSVYGRGEISNLWGKVNYSWIDLDHLAAINKKIKVDFYLTLNKYQKD
jgi:hypothetical protein